MFPEFVPFRKIPRWSRDIIIKGDDKPKGSTE